MKNIKRSNKTIKQELKDYNKDTDKSVDKNGLQYAVENFGDMTYVQVEESIQPLIIVLLNYDIMHFSLGEVLKIHEFKKFIRLSGGIEKCSDEDIVTLYIELKIIQKNYETRKTNHNVKIMFGGL